MSLRASHDVLSRKDGAMTASQFEFACMLWIVSGVFGMMIDPTFWDAKAHYKADLDRSSVPKKMVFFMVPVCLAMIIGPYAFYQGVRNWWRNR